MPGICPGATYPGTCADRSGAIGPPAPTQRGPPIRRFGVWKPGLALIVLLFSQRASRGRLLQDPMATEEFGQAQPPDRADRHRHADALEGWYCVEFAPPARPTATSGRSPRTRRASQINAVSNALKEGYEAQLAQMKQADLARRLASERVDVPSPAPPAARGGYPSAQAVRESWTSSHACFRVRVRTSRPTAPRNWRGTCRTPSSPPTGTSCAPTRPRAMHPGPGPLRVELPGLCYRNRHHHPPEMQFHQIEVARRTAAW